jgi:hypothetical protein
MNTSRACIAGVAFVGLALGWSSETLPAGGTTLALSKIDPQLVSQLTERRPVADEPAPYFWDSQSGRRAGAEAGRFELDDPDHSPTLSIWYHVAYIVGGERLRVYDQSLPTERGSDSAIAKSQNVAWHVAMTLLGRSRAPARPGEIPDWARPRTARLDGPSAGLLYALADLDLLTPGRLAGSLRVAATGAVGSDGVVTSVRMVEAKLAAARLARSDVFFAPAIPAGEVAAMVLSHQGRPEAPGAIGDWLNTEGYELAGRAASAQSGVAALVQVDDVRQALAWLCGRTQRPETCAVAQAAAAVPFDAARPYRSPSIPGSVGARAAA